MIGPSLKIVEMLVCEGCERAVYRDMEATLRFPREKRNHYCTHEAIDLKRAKPIQYLKGYPKTPKWCPERTGAKGNHDARAR